MSTWVFTALHYVILVTALVALIRFKQISTVYLPFLVLTWVGAANEVLNLFLLLNGYYNIYNFNAYQLIEAILIVWQFQRWRLFDNPKSYLFLYGAMLAAFMVDNLFVSGFHDFNSFFRIFYAVPVVLLSIHMINKLLLTERTNLLRHASFLVCCGFVLFFTFSILSEVFQVYGAFLSTSFLNGLYSIMTWTNLLSNLIFVLAVSWMPSRHAFSLPY